MSTLTGKHIYFKTRPDHFVKVSVVLISRLSDFDISCTGLVTSVSSVCVVKSTFARLVQCYSTPP